MTDIETTSTYRSSFRTDWVPTCSLDTAFFKKMYEIIIEINQKATDLEVAALVREPDQPEEEFENVKQLARDICKLRVLIYGSKGEFLSSNSSTVFDSSNFPDSLAAVIFDNSIDFRFKAKQNPRHFVKVEFDFTKPQIFDLDTNPSKPTPNKSCITVQGEDEQWADWAFGKIKSSIEVRKNNRNWLHLRHYVYDLFLWFAILPLALWNLYKLEIRLSSHLRELSTVLQLAIYIYAFLLILIVFRALFDYARWVFPYLEFVSPNKSSAMKHRLILVGLLTSLSIVLIRDFIMYIVPLLF